MGAYVSNIVCTVSFLPKYYWNLQKYWWIRHKSLTTYKLTHNIGFGTNQHPFMGANVSNIVCTVSFYLIPLELLQNNWWRRHKSFNNITCTNTYVNTSQNISYNCTFDSYQGFEGSFAPQGCRQAVSRASFEPDYSSLLSTPYNANI